MLSLHKSFFKKNLKFCTLFKEAVLFLCDVNVNHRVRRMDMDITSSSRRPQDLQYLVHVMRPLLIRVEGDGLGTAMYDQVADRCRNIAAVLCTLGGGTDLHINSTNRFALPTWPTSCTLLI